MVYEIKKTDSKFPEAFKSIGDDCPDVIFCSGNLSLLKKTGMVAIIGARSADEAGVKLAYKLGVRFSSIVVISGLAKGIDTAAHNGCVDVDAPTIAVVGTGLDKVHPKENVLLQQRILDSGGLIITEQLDGTKASPRTLIARTRLQMALADTVIVVECEKESGTMHAVNYALKYHKPIYAVDNNWSGNRYLLDNNIATIIHPESEYMHLGIPNFQTLS